jgi:hypothetical protein
MSNARVKHILLGISLGVVIPTAIIIVIVELYILCQHPGTGSQGVYSAHILKQYHNDNNAPSHRRRQCPLYAGRHQQPLSGWTII